MPQLNLQEVRDLIKNQLGDGVFIPCAFVDNLGSLKIINRDCSELHEPINGTNLELIRDAHTSEVVGIVVHKWGVYKKDSL